MSTEQYRTGQYPDRSSTSTASAAGCGSSLLDGGQVGTERRHRMHYKLACRLQEAGVSAEEAFVLLWETQWNKHTHETPVWTLIEKVWSR
jgi:hypothetical protein